MSPTKATIGTQPWRIPANAPAVGATIALDPMSGVGPFYTSSDDQAEIDVEVTAITATFTGFFFNVDPGEVTLSVSLDGYHCDSNYLGGDLPLPMTVSGDAIFWVLPDCVPD